MTALSRDLRHIRRNNVLDFVRYDPHRLLNGGERPNEFQYRNGYGVPAIVEMRGCQHEMKQPIDELWSEYPIAKHDRHRGNMRMRKQQMAPVHVFVPPSHFLVRGEGNDYILDRFVSPTE